MPLDRKFTNVIEKKTGNRREITELTVLNENDRNTIYNLIFSERAPGVEDEDKRK